MKPFDKFIVSVIPKPKDAQDTESFCALAQTKEGIEKLTPMLDTAFREMMIGDPSASQWSRYGFAAPNPHAEKVTVEDKMLGEIEDVPLVSKNIGYSWFLFEERARMLSPSTIRDEVEKRAVAFEERVLEAPNKRERAEMRDEVIAELLPKATIKRTRIPVIITPGRLIIFAGSKNVADKVTATMRKALGSLPVIDWLQCGEAVTAYLKKLARKDDLAEGDDYEPWNKFAKITIVSNAKIKLETGIYSFSDVEDLTFDESFVTALKSSDGYLHFGLTEARIVYEADNGDPLYWATLTSKGVIKGIKDLSDETEDDAQYDDDSERESVRIETSAYLGYVAATHILASLEHGGANVLGEEEDL